MIFNKKNIFLLAYTPFAFAIFISGMFLYSFLKQPKMYEEPLYETYTENDFEITLKWDEVVLTSYAGNGGDVVIPCSVQGYEIMSIDNKVFQNNENIISIVFPDSITNLGGFDLYGMIHLQSVTLPANLRVLPSSFFENCSSLTNVIIGDSLTKISRRSFFGCESLQTISLPASVNDISSTAFSHCSSLKNIIFNEGNTNYTFEDGILFDIENNALHTYLRSNNRNEYTVPDGISSIGSWAFWHNDNLETIHFPESLILIDNGAFAWCQSLVNVNFPSSLIEIKDDAFLLCSSLENVTLPSSIEVLGDAFPLCDNLMLEAEEGSYAYDFIHSQNAEFSIIDEIKDE